MRRILYYWCLASPGKEIGDAGAILSGAHGSVVGKNKAFRHAGVLVAERPRLVGTLLRSAIR